MATENHPLLRVMPSGEPPREYVLDVSLVHLGRSESSDIVVKQPQVSANHLDLRREGDGFRLIDKDSTNGTKVNGVRVTDIILKDGDEILIGGEVAALYRASTSEKPAAKPFSGATSLPPARPPIKIAKPMPPGG